MPSMRTWYNDTTLFHAMESGKETKMARVATASDCGVTIATHPRTDRLETWEQLAIRSALRLLCNIDAGIYTLPRDVSVKLSTTDGSEPEREVTVRVDLKFKVNGMRGIDDDSR